MALEPGVPIARRLHITGVVQGVGFRPHVYRLARMHGLRGWIVNGNDGVQVHVEGRQPDVEAFLRDLVADPPPAARVSTIDVAACAADPSSKPFEIRGSLTDAAPTTRLSPDLPICDRCLSELFDRRDRRHRYPYINCTNCGPRYSIIASLPYDRGRTTMAGWPLCPACDTEYHDPENRRFHAQPVACADCGPDFLLTGECELRGAEAIARAADLLARGRIVAVKGIGGYHLACDAGNAEAVATLRERKFRKEQAFAVMARDLGVAEATVTLDPQSRGLLLSQARPIVLAPARLHLPGVAPDSDHLGVMLPYAPLHHLLFDAGAPSRLVFTSGNRSSEPIAYRDEDAIARLSGLADAILIGERPIARRVDDSIVRAGALGPVVIRRSRGLAPASAASFRTKTPALAVGADLKNAVTLVVDGEAYVSQHIGDLLNLESRRAFEQTIDDLLAMYDVVPTRLLVAHDRHPEYVSTVHALGVNSKETVSVQHHRAHVASVLAERGMIDRHVVGVALDGTGFGDDGTIWGGEFFVGSIAAGFRRVGGLRPAALPGGDAAARHPVQAAAGYLSQLHDVPDLLAPPFSFPDRYTSACALLRSSVRLFTTTSAGRLFDAVAALLGFVRPVTFEGQAAMWLEHLARQATGAPRALPCRVVGSEIDWRETLQAVIVARRGGVSAPAVARAFHRGLAHAIAALASDVAELAGVDAVALSGGVMQNDLLLADIRDAMAATRLELLTNRHVPPNDGGISLGQAALALFGPRPSLEVGTPPRL
jgi:hydrogenase maturation protein HypF